MKKCCGPFGAVALATAAGVCLSASALAQVSPITADRTDVPQATDPITPPGPPVEGYPAPRGEPEIDCTIAGVSNCQNFEYPRVLGTSFTSSGAPGVLNPIRVADHFRTGPAGGDVTLTQFCWWGAYNTAGGCAAVPPADSFRIRIYDRVNSGENAGVPDEATARERSQAAGNLTITRRLICDAANNRHSFEYTATTTQAITLNPDTCYFIEIFNTVPTGTTWYWSRCAFSTDGMCFHDLGGTTPTYQVTELVGSTVAPSFTADRAYCMDLDLAVFDTGVCLPPVQPPPPNDTCDTAILLTVGGATATGDTTLAANDNALPCGSARENQGRGVWYRVVGNGNTLTATTCLPGTTPTFDSKLSVYCGDSCASLNCVAGNDDAAACAANALASTVSWCSESGRTYYILVHGFNGAVGAFEIGVTGNATPCTAEPCEPCVVMTPVGALEEPSSGCPPVTPDPNGGCNTGQPPQPNMTPIACGDVFHGTAWANADTRDTDWYLLTLTETQVVTVTLTSEFPGVTFFVAFTDMNTCTGPSFPGGVAAPDPCGTETNEALLTGPGQYVLFVAVGQPGGGGTFSGVPCDGVNNDYVLSVACQPPCNAVVTIPPNATDENEVCGTDANGGCNAVGAAAFEMLPASGVLHGTSWAVGGTRDTDWFQATAPASGMLSVDIDAEFNASVFLLDITFLPDQTCDVVTLLGAANTCGPGTVTGTTTAGATYYIFVAPGSAGGPIFDGLPCDQDYVLTVAGGPACPCDFNNDNVLNSQDYFDFLTCFFAGPCPPGQDSDFNDDNVTNSQDYFDFLVCFFAPPPGCP
jgi:hypothetical protein